MASIYDKASLVLIPSGTKTSKVYSQKPTNGDGDFTFSRSTAATRVNASGNIEKETGNLFTYSNTFSNSAWNKNAGGSFTSGQAGYDGSNDAWQFNVTTASNSGTWQNVAFSGVATFSAYFKKGTIDKIGFTNYAGSAYECWFDLTNGTIGQQTGDLIDANIESVGGGWYRCSITDVGSGNNYFQLKPSNAYSGVSTAGYIYIQDAQLEQGLVARDYIETTTTAIYGGITDNVPRLDYTDSSCPALLLEPQRTNQVLHSEYGGSGYWSKSNSTTTNNAAISPEGVQNAFELTDNTSDGYHWIYKSAIDTGNNHRISFFAKSNTLSEVWANGGDGVKSARFNLSNGTIMQQVGGSQATIEDYGNGWYRCSFTADYGGILIATSKNGISTYAGTGQSIYMYGIQSESSTSYATSYIPTYGSAVTRNQSDVNKFSATDLIGQDEGSFFIEVKIDELSLENRFILTISDFAQSEGFFVRHRNSNDLQFYSFGLTNNFDFRQSITSGGTFKLAGAYKSGDIVFYVDGTQVNTGTTTFSTPDLSVIRLGRAASNSSLLGGGIKQALLFKTRLSNEELADLTTL